MEEPKEQRRHKRYPLNGGALEFNGRTCRLNDISVSGLSFHYLAGRHSAKDDELGRILFDQDECCLDTLPLETVWDRPEPVPHYDNQVRRRGMRFRAITPLQRTMIEYFIWLNAPR